MSVQSIPVTYARAGAIDPSQWSFCQHQRRPQLRDRIKALLIKAFLWIKTSLYSVCHLRHRIVYLEGGCERFLQERVVRALRSCLVASPQTKSRDAKKCYGEIVSQWRNPGKSRSQIKEALYRFFHSTEFFETVQKEIFSILPELEMCGSLIELERVYRKARSRFPAPTVDTPAPFDPILQGNVPFSWYRLPLRDSKEVILVRMPTATRDILGPDGKRTTAVVVTGEFQAYIEALKDRGEKHLYVNLMTIAAGCHETIRSKALSDFGREHRDACVVVSLDKNSPFYMQEKEPEKEQKDLFFDKLIHSFEDANRYLWPISLSADQLHTYQEEAVNVARNVYKDVSTLSRHQRSVLIDVVHTEMIRLFTEHYKPTTMNISCRNCIDRGVAQQVELIAAMSPQPSKDVFSKPVLSVALGSAVLVSSRPMQSDRFARLLSVLDVLLKEKEETR